MSLSHAITVMLVAAAPVSELRGALPLGISYGMPWGYAFALSVIGNLVPVLPILLLAGWTERHLRRFAPSRRLMETVFARTRRKGRLVERYGALGLIMIVAIPLPATGAWTGAIVAFLTGMEVRKAFTLIALGVLIAGAIIPLAPKAGIYNFAG